MAIKSQKSELLTQPLRTKSSGHNLSLSTLALGVLGIACSFTSAHALEIGKSTVNSNQNEPLSATINVSDIDANNFSAKLASPSAYANLQLKQSVPMTVRFVKTSANSGKLVVQSSAPVSDPFADVVLQIDDAGKQATVPKTLLLPLSDTSRSAKISNTSSVTISATPTPNLPTVSATGTPLAVKKSAPPPLKPISDPADNTAAPSASQTVANNEINRRKLVQNTDTLITKETRRIVPAGSVAVPPPVADYFKSQMANASANTAPVATPSNPSLTNANQRTNTNSSDDDSSNNESADTLATNAQNRQEAARASLSTPKGDVTYRVERHDNLWTIALQIAKQNNVSVDEVMQHIVAYNPNSFVNNNKNQLLANTTLTLPAYEVIPSKLGVRAAKEARQATRSLTEGSSAKRNATAGRQTGNSSVNGQSNLRQEAASSNSSTNRGTNKTAQSASSKPSDARLTIVTPNADAGRGASASGQSSSSGSGLSSSLVNQLQASRSLTASQARRVGELNSQLNNRTQQLQIQNQKLADLEERLRKLREQ